MKKVEILGMPLLVVLVLLIGIGVGACGGGDVTPTLGEEEEEELVSPPAPAKFEVTSLNIEPPEIAAGETVTITAVVENTGGSEGTYAAILTVNGVSVETKDVTITPDSSEAITFSLVEDAPGTYEIGVGELSSSLVVIDTWALTGPPYFLGTFSFDTMQTLMSYQGSVLGGTIDYVYQQLSRHWDSIQESNTFILFCTSFDDLQRLGEWPEQYKEVCPFSIDELEAYNLPFAWLKRQDNGLIRAIILVDNEPDILTFITVIENTQVPVGIPWTLTNGEVTAIEGY